jgi:hypothetical protein
MVKTRKKEAGEMQPGDHTMPEGPVSGTSRLEQGEATGIALEPPTARSNGLDGGVDSPPPQSFAAKAAEERRSYPPIPDPFAIATINTPDNQLHLGKSQRLRAFVIRFNNNPNEGRDKADPHPVIALLKDAGYKYRSIPGDGMAWQKPWEDGTYRVREDMDARDIASMAAEAMGAKIEPRMGR